MPLLELTSQRSSTSINPIGHSDKQLVALKLKRPGLQVVTQVFPYKRKFEKHLVHVFAIGHEKQLLEQGTQIEFYDLVPSGQETRQLLRYS